jgi:hypothetical protein
LGTYYNYSMDSLFERLDRSEKQIALVKNKQARRDLMKMITTIDIALTSADMESVECRRLHRNTPKYNDLIKTANDLLTNLEQHITFAHLLGS